MRWAAVPFCLGLASYLPQFFLPPTGRIVHGLVLLVGAALWVVAEAQASRRATATA
ncbi:hypothetical protein [Aestuariimicrobium ganziense]|uniref:hypothetical protein n=1 Tax=Aestuariimicrobium ganziense TaxID=2773677 RepID=UPI0019435C60|nr:hypothetical protein [Aestuariimicrobium ganziense]